MDSRPVTVHYIGGPYDGAAETHPYATILERLDHRAPKRTAAYIFRSRPVMDGSSGSVYADYTHG